jgi:hypothetical protein
MDELNSIEDRLKICITEKERNALEQQLDNIKRRLEASYKNVKKTAYDDVDEIEYYPDIDDPEFNQKIFNKKEFRDHIMRKRNVESGIMTSMIEEMIFRRTPSQNFTAHYISTKTPYNGVLLWHGVGIGKTCTALSIAENFHDYVVSHKKKILILTPSDTLRETWRNEIFNVNKELDKYRKNIRSNVQCTGDRYTKEIHVDWNQIAKESEIVSEENYKKIKKRVNSVINKYYEILGYQMLVNKIENEMAQLNILDPDIAPEFKRVDYIKRRFSNTVIIMDEAHFIRDKSTNVADTDNKKDYKLATPYLEMIARYAENTKIILSTATPMYNEANEIIWLLNILLWNDRRAPLLENEIFKSDSSFVSESSKLKLVETAQGYISYVRSENPFDFPLKLEPIDEEHVYTPKPSNMWIRGAIKPLKDRSSLIKDIKFFKNPMSKFQYEVFENIMRTEGGEGASGFDIKPREASNIVFPNKKVGEAGFSECIEYNSDKRKWTYADSYMSEEDFKPFLEERFIREFSAKFKNILESIKSCKGIIFIYSQFLSSGISALAMVLEENGFKRCIEPNKFAHVFSSATTANKNNDFCAKYLDKYGNLSDDEKKDFHQASYIYLESKTKSKLNDLLRVTNDPDNRYGHNVKVILGSRVTAQGLNFRNVREVHILEPWFHFNALEQSIGRAIRRGSHNNLPPEERNTTIYIHTATPPEDHKHGEKRVETSDEKAYRISYHKAEFMSEVQRLLKENAIDCENNLYGNVYLKEDYENMDREIVDSKGNKRTVHIYDRDNSLLCDMRKCALTCKSTDTIVVRNVPLELDTFSPEHQSNRKVIYKEIIKQIFIKDQNYTEEGIVREIIRVAQDMGFIPASMNDTDYKLNRDIIFKCITEMINDKEYVYNYEYRPGIIQEFKGTYVYTPVELKDMDKNMPILNRDFPNMKRIPSKEDIANGMCYYTKKDEEKYEIEEKKSEEDYTEELLELYDVAEYYINKYFNEYDDVEESSNINKPTKRKLVIYKFHSLFEVNNDSAKRFNILKSIVLKHFNNIQLSEVEKHILNYYDTPNKNTFIIRGKNNDIQGVIEIKISPEKQIIQNVYMRYENIKLVPITESSLIEKYLWKPWQNKAKKIGWLGYNRSKEVKFFVFNDVRQIKSDDLKENLKHTLSGTQCTTGSPQQHTSKKEDMLEFLNELRYKKGVDAPTKKEMCDEVELLLRHYDTIYGTRELRYFYRMEEHDYLVAIENETKKSKK